MFFVSCLRCQLWKPLLWMAIVALIGSALNGQELPMTVALNGQLGNQMFQIATCLATAKRHGLSYTVPDLIQETRWGVPENRRAIFWRVPVRALRPSISGPVFREKDWTNMKVIPGVPGLHLQGFFQSEQYFADCRNDILQLFAEPAGFWETLCDRYPILHSPHCVGLHVRVYHDPQYDAPLKHPTFGRAYYERACALMPPDSVFVVVSNNIEAARAILKGIPGEFHFLEGSNRFDDLSVLTHCQHVIGSNSSFSWWGAWLGDFPGRICVFPFPWLSGRPTRSSAPDLIPSRWQVLECPDAILTNAEAQALLGRSGFKHRKW
jgi:hypothetical protein